MNDNDFVRVKELEAALTVYLHCRHGQAKCFCTKEAQEALTVLVNYNRMRERLSDMSREELERAVIVLSQKLGNADLPDEFHLLSV